MKEKEPEFIVSPEELKKNQERAYAREYYEKKEKEDKKVTVILILLACAMIIILAISLKNYTEKGVNNCIKAGNSEYFCNVNLRS